LTKLKYIPLILTVLVSCSSHPEKMPNSVQDMLDKYEWKMETFAPCDLSDLSDFMNHDRYYLMEEHPADVWEKYSNLDPNEIWQGYMTRFGAMYVPEENCIYTPGDELPVLAEGQVVFLDLLVEDFLHIPVVFQIASIDRERMSITFTYAEENKSHGYQEIEIIPFDSEAGTSTVLRHSTRYRSDSEFRDIVFYREYHSRMVDEFHADVAAAGNYAVKVISVKRLERIGALLTDQAPD
jgi:hypothetical protein